MTEENKIDFIKDNLNRLSGAEIDEVVKLLDKACVPRKAFRVDVKIDTDDDFVIVDEENGDEYLYLETVAYLDTEDECFDWLKDFADTIEYRYEQKKALVEWVQGEILKMVKNRDCELCLSGNQEIEISISKTLH